MIMRGGKMKVNKLKNLEKIVEGIIRNDKLAREDDCYLILKVVEKIYPNEVGKTFTDVMFNAKSRGINLESITRCRRKLQERYPELKENETSIIREQEQEAYINYALGKEEE